MRMLLDTALVLSCTLQCILNAAARVVSNCGKYDRGLVADPVSAPHFTLARRRRPDPVQAVRPTVQVSAQHGFRISGRALQTCLQHRRSLASAICWPWSARCMFRKSGCQLTEDAHSAILDLQLGTLFLTS